MNKRRVLITSILFLVIGFASVSTTLIVNGGVSVRTNLGSYIDGLVFDEDSITSNNGTTARLSESGRTITFTTQEMKSVDEMAIVNFKIKNYSQYDAVLGTPAIRCYFVDDYMDDTKSDEKSLTNEYMKIIPGNELDGAKLEAGEISNQSSITIKQIKSYIEDTQATLKFQCEINSTATDSATPSSQKPSSYNVSFNTDGGESIDTIHEVKYKRAYGELPTPTHNNTSYEFLGWYTEAGAKVDENSIVNIKNDHTLKAYWYGIVEDKDGDNIADIGDEIIIGTESFYVIKNDESNLEALAKYNLNVGGNKDTTKTEGIQQPGGNYTVSFSKTSTWAQLNPIDITNPDYRYNSEATKSKKTVLDVLYTTNTSAGIIGYQDYIKGLVPNSKKISVRLLNKDEFSSLKDAGYTWVYDTSYWTQTAHSYRPGYVWHTTSSGGMSNNYYIYANYGGVRPVITISIG